MWCNLLLQRLRAPAGRKRRGVRLSLNQRLSGKILRNMPALICGRKESIMLSCGKIVHRLKPVGIMGRSLFNCPILHRAGNCVGNFGVQTFPQSAGSGQTFINLLGQAFSHYTVIKNAAAKNFFEVHGILPLFFYHTDTSYRCVRTPNCVRNRQKSQPLA